VTETRNLADALETSVSRETIHCSLRSETILRGFLFPDLIQWKNGNNMMGSVEFLEFEFEGVIAWARPHTKKKFIGRSLTPAMGLKTRSTSAEGSPDLPFL
jgi:hypothetical protein